jgi:outer membrane protein OmpA-like peptidoglycan-associated protein
MEATLAAQADVDDAALAALATARAQAVRDALAQRGVADDRLFVTAARVGAAPAAAARDAGAGAPAHPAASTRVDLSLR